MKILNVIPLVKGPFSNLTYFTSKDIQDGQIVEITIRNKKSLGLVLSSVDASNSKSEIKNMDFNLKKVVKVKEKIIFRKEFLSAMLETSKYFLLPSNEVFSALIPSILIEEYDKIPSIETNIENTNILNLKAEKLLYQSSWNDRISFYKTLIRSSFAEKKSIFIVLPTERDINIFNELLSKGIEQFTFNFHSGIKNKKILENIANISIEKHPVLILATPPYLSCIKSDTGIIILEKESSNSYRNFNYQDLDMRIFVEIFAVKINVRFILADSFLRFESIARKELDYFTELSPLSFRVNTECNIKISGEQDKFQILNDESVEQINKKISQGESVFIFSLRKGLATITLCKDCREILLCDDCMAPLVLYTSKNGKNRMFICNKCNIEKETDTRCMHCNSWNLISLGIGIDTVKEELIKIFPNIKIFQIDKDSTKTSKNAEKIIKDFEKSKGSILLGTQMVFPYIEEKVPLTVIASFDSLWSIPNFKMSEKIIEILFSCIAKTKDELIIQTKNKKDGTLLAIKNESLNAFVREELIDRKNLGYPPYKRFIKITHTGNKDEISNIQKTFTEVFKDYNPDIFSGFISKLKNQYNTNALIKLDTKKWSLPSLSPSSTIDEKLFSLLSSLPPTFRISIDPESLL